MSKSPLATWTERLRAMQQCRTVADLLHQYGPPPHKIKEGTMEIWHYPLGVSEGVSYRIHVVVLGTHVPQAYMHMVPAGGAMGPPGQDS